MTLPINLDLPLTIDQSNPKDVERYVKDLSFSIKDMYERTAQNVNGTIRSYADTDQSQWIPVLKTDGVNGTINYTRQYGWCLRQGIITEIWFDISWNSIGSTTGKIYLELPYKVIPSNGNPFVGPVNCSTIIGLGDNSIFINGNPNSYQGQFWKSDGITGTPAWINIAKVGQLYGHLRYLGIEDE